MITDGEYLELHTEDISHHIGEELATMEKQNPEACMQFLKTYDTVSTWN